MKGILADNNIQGHLEILLRVWLSPEWREIWQSLNLAIHSFEEFGLDRQTTDVLLWQECQKRNVVLLTANRNNEGPDSLESAIRNQTLTTLPVFTLAHPRRVQTDSSYAARVAIKLLQFFLDIDSLGGSGRLYVP